jgi:translation initiation factor 2 subunit 1
MANTTDEAAEVQIYRSHGRFYENEFPEVDETVVVQVLKIDDKIGAYVSLLEYDEKEGMINLGELSKKRIRSLAKILRIGSIEVVSVMSVDEEKGYINLSKKRVEPEDAPPKLEQYAKAKAVHGIMQHVSKSNGIDVEDLCTAVSWPLHTKHKQAFDAFKRHIEEEGTDGAFDVWNDIDFSSVGEEMAPKIKEEIETHMRRRLIASTLRLQAKCDVSCSGYEGIDAIKEALSEGFKASKPECEVHIKLIAHPTFALSCQCKDKELGIHALTEALGYVEKAIKERKGHFSLISVPQIHKKEEQKEESDSEKDSDEDSEEASDMGDLDQEALKNLEAVKVDDDEKADED